MLESVAPRIFVVDFDYTKLEQVFVDSIENLDCIQDSKEVGEIGIAIGCYIGVLYQG